MVRGTIASAISSVALAACAHAAAPAVPAPAPANLVAPPPVPDEPFAPRTLRGPYRSLEEYCGKLALTPTFDLDVDSTYCAPDPGAPTADARPFRGVDVFARVDPAGPFRHCHLAIEAVNGWYVDPDELDCHLEADQHGRIVGSLQVEPLVGDHDLVVGLSESFMLCEIGRSGVPSCTPPIPTVTFDYDLDEKVAVGVRAEPGAITLSVPEDELALDEVPTDWHRIAGRHTLVFP